MTPEEPIHVWFCSPDTHFAEVIGRTLGAGFDLRISDRVDATAATGQEGWWDVVLLDSKDAQNGASVDAVLTLMDEIKRANAPSPIMVMMRDDSGGRFQLRRSGTTCSALRHFGMVLSSYIHRAPTMVI